MAISLTYTFSANTTIASAQVNSNFSTLATRALDKTGDTMTGSLLFTDATYDIGATGATRPRDLFLSRDATIGRDCLILSNTGLLKLGASSDVILARDGAQTLAQKNSTNAQSFRVYGNTTGPLYSQLQHDGTSGAVGSNSGGGTFSLFANAITGLTLDIQGYIDSATQPRASAFNNATQSHGSSGSYVVLTFDSEDYDVGTCHSTSSNTSRLTVPAGGDGIYHVIAIVRFASNATGERGARFLRNGAVLQEGARVKANDVDDTVMTISMILSLSAADYIEVAGLQTSGGALNMGSATDGSECRLQFVKLW